MGYLNNLPERGTNNNLLKIIGKLEKLFKIASFSISDDHKHVFKIYSFAEELLKQFKIIDENDPLFILTQIIL